MFSSLWTSHDKDVSQPEKLGSKTCLQALDTLVPSKSERRQPGQGLSQAQREGCGPGSRSLWVPLLVAKKAAAPLLAHVHRARMAHLALAQPAVVPPGEEAEIFVAAGAQPCIAGHWARHRSVDALCLLPQGILLPVGQHRSALAGACLVGGCPEARPGTPDPRWAPKFREVVSRICLTSGALLWAKGFVWAPCPCTVPHRWGTQGSHRSSSSSRPFMSRMSSCCRACSAPRVASRSRASRCAR